MEKIREKEEVLNFLRVDEYPSGYGDGDGSGSGYGDGYGNGSGYGYGDGDGSGYGYGDGYGSGYGSGYGDGYCYGYGDGSGYGDGDGDGDGDGYGDNIEYFNSQRVYKIDNINTLIDSVHGNYAKGRILCDDLTTKDCYVVKCGNYFAHGESLKQAMSDAREKYEENAPIEERIARFNEEYPDRNIKVPASELFSWHHILTGSCLMGRKQFCEEHDIDYKDGSYTVNEFIALTRNAFGGDVIRQLETTSP